MENDKKMEIKVKGARVLTLQGKDGEKGEKGDIIADGVVVIRGQDGKDAIPPSNEELLSLIKPLIPEPIKPKDGRDGRNGFDGIDGKDADESRIITEVSKKIPIPKDGIDGKDGSSDTGLEIVKKVNHLNSILEWKVIKNAPNFALHEDILTRFRSNNTGGGNMNRQIKVEGVDVLTRYTDINFIGTTSSVLASNDNTNKRVNITIPSGSGTGSITGSGATGQVTYWTGTSSITGDTNFFWDIANANLRIGPTNAAITTQNRLSVTGNANDYHGIYAVNASAGALASTDIVTGNDLGGVNDYFDFGVNSSGNTNASFTAFGASDAYIFTGPGGALNNIVIATGTSGKAIKFATGGTLAANIRMTLDGTGLLGLNQTTPTSRFHLNGNAIGVTPLDSYGIFLANSTVAAAGAQQQSPGTVWQGNGWKTNATAASQDVRFRASVLPVQGAANPTANWILESSINGGAYGSRLTVDSTGAGTFGGNLVASIIRGSQFTTSTTGSDGNFWAAGTTTAVSTSTAAYLFGGAAAVRIRVGVYGNTSTTLTANDSYSAFVVASTPITMPASGTAALLASAVFNPLGTVTNGSAIPITNTATVYIGNAGSGGTNNYALWVDAGSTRLDGDNFNAGYLQVGLTTAPTNTTAGDLTAIRGVFTGQGILVGTSTFTSERMIDVRGTSTATANGATIGANFLYTLTPASNSSADFRAINFQNTAGGASSSGITLDNIEAGHFEGARFGATQDAQITSVTGVVGWGAVPASGAAATILVTTVYGAQFFGIVQPSGTSNVTTTDIIGVDITGNNASAGTITATNLRGLRINNNAAGTFTNVYGLDITGQTRGSTLNYGIRVGLSSGATTNAAINLTDTTGVVGGGILFGTDVTLYRSAANVLRTDDAFTLKAGTGTKYANSGGKIKEFYTSVGNIGLGEDDLYTYTTEASILGSDGDELNGSFGLKIVTSAGTATRQIKLWFGGTAIFDTTALLYSGASDAVILYTITRVSSTSVRYRVTLTTQGATLAAYTSVNTLGSLTLSNTNILKLTGEAAGVGAATDDIIAHSGSVFWMPVSI